jgi:hypothetical protein
VMYEVSTSEQAQLARTCGVRLVENYVSVK